MFVRSQPDGKRVEMGREKARGPSGRPESPPGHGKVKRSLDWPCPPQWNCSALPPATLPCCSSPLICSLASPGNKREELNSIPSPGHPLRPPPPPPPPPPFIAPHKSFSELPGSETGLQAGAQVGVWGWGQRGQGLACPSNAGLGAGTSEPCRMHPGAPNAGIRAGTGLLSVTSP